MDWIALLIIRSHLGSFVIQSFWLGSPVVWFHSLETFSVLKCLVNDTDKNVKSNHFKINTPPFFQFSRSFPKTAPGLDGKLSFMSFLSTTSFLALSWVHFKSTDLEVSLSLPHVHFLRVVFIFWLCDHKCLLASSYRENCSRSSGVCQAPSVE